MPIPTDLLDAAAAHPCFSGVFDSGNHIEMHQGNGPGPVQLIDFQCEDCLSFRLGCRADALPPSMSHRQAAELVTEHVRRLRGYALSVGGYHTVISGWLSAAYWDAAGLFVLCTDRGSSGSKPPLDVLLHAMHMGLVKPTHPAMLDPQQYQTRQVFLSVVPPPAVTSMGALLTSAHVATSWKQGYSRVTLAEFLPVSRATTAAPVPLPRATPARPVVREQGKPCPVCGETVGERWLLTSSYIGCRCG